MNAWSLSWTEASKLPNNSMLSNSPILNKENFQPLLVYSNLWSPSYFYNFSNCLNSYSRKSLPAIAERNHLIFPPQICHLIYISSSHSSFLPVLNQEGFLLKGSFSCALDFISVHFFLNLVWSVFSYSWFNLSLYLILHLTSKHILLFLTVKVNLVPLSPPDNYKVLITIPHIYLALSRCQTYSEAFLSLTSWGEGESTSNPTDSGAT